MLQFMKFFALAHEKREDSPLYLQARKQLFQLELPFRYQRKKCYKCHMFLKSYL